MSDLSAVVALLQLDPRVRAHGRLHSSLAYVSLTGTSNTALLTVPDGATLLLFALEVFNRNAATVYLSVGTGSSLTQLLPRQGPFLTNFHVVVPLPPTEFQTDIYVTSSAGAAATSDVHVKAYAVAIG